MRKSFKVGGQPSPGVSRPGDGNQRKVVGNGGSGMAMLPKVKDSKPIPLNGCTVF